MYGRSTFAQQVLEGCRNAQHNGQYAQALPSSDAAQYGAIACAEVDHLPRAAGHAGEERSGAILTAAAQMCGLT